MRLITDKNLCNTLLAQIQTNALAKGNCHWGGYKQWCIHGEEIEQAIKDIFAEDNPFKPTIDIVRCNECQHRGNMACPLYNEEYIPRDYDGYDEGEWVITDNTCDDGFCDRGERREGE